MPGNCLFEKNGATDGAQRKQTTRAKLLSAHGRAFGQMFVKTGNCLFVKKNGATDGA